MSSHVFYRPGKSDVMGDRWAMQTGEIWDRMTELDSELTGKPHAYSLWQWMMCKLAEMEHRVIASPQAIALAQSVNGGPKPDTSLIEPLLELSDKVFEEKHGKV